MLKLKNKQLIPNFNTTIKKFFLKFCYFSMLTLYVACGAEPENKTIVEPAVNTTNETEPTITSKKTIMFFGDSLTAGYGLDAIEDAFPNLIQQNIDSLSLGYTVINSGVSGETSSGGKNRIDWVLSTKVDVFVLELGANDGLRGVPLKETRQNLQAIIDVVRKKNPKTKIVLTGMQIPPNMVLDFNFKNERYVIINNHLKCCGDGILNTTNTSDEENRRLNATRLLKEYMDDNLSDVNVFLVGDFNDHIHDVRAHNVFQEFIDDSEDYVFADMDIANGTNTNWSFPSWPSHLDHILITNELFDEFQLNTTVVETIKVDDYVGGWNNYDTNITDHRPVAIKFTPSATLSIDNLTLNSIEFKSYPNPISNQTTFSIKNVSGVKSLRILDVLGREVFKSSAIKDKNYVWNRTSLPSGMYFAKLYANNQLVKTIKVLLE